MPLHMSTGILIACRIIERIAAAHRRQNSLGCFALRALWLPVLVHGAFDLLQMFMIQPPSLDADTQETIKFVCFVSSALVAFTLFFYAFWVAWSALVFCNEFERELHAQSCKHDSAPLIPSGDAEKSN